MRYSKKQVEYSNFPIRCSSKMTAADWVHLFILSFFNSSFKPRRIYRLPLLLFISAELISERHAEFAEATVMVRHMLRLEADARRNLPRFKDVVAIDIQDGFILGKTVAQGGIHVARRRQVVNALDGVAVYEAGQGQFQIGLGAKGEIIGHLCNAVTLAAVERNVPEITVLLVKPHSDKAEARIQPILYLEGHRCLYACQLFIVVIHIFINFHQALGRLVKQL